MDVPTLEEEAFAGAVKQVASMIQRSDQLDKLDHYKSMISRKKAAVDAMLKTAVHVQLENVRAGLNQLNFVAKDAEIIAEHCQSMNAELSKIQEIKQKLRTLNEASRKHMQCSTAIENLKAIYEIQETVDKTYEMISSGRLLEAHCNLVELENARDNVMFEVFKTKAESDYDQKILADYFSELFKLADELAKQVFYIIGRTLEAVRGTDPGPQRLVTALRIVEREEQIDQFCVERHLETGFIPVKRPRKWRERCFHVLEKMVRQRVEGNQLEDRMLHKEWLARYLELIRITVVDDLCVVKRGCIPCFPPDYHIFDRFLEMYHTSIGNRLREIASDNLEKNELIQLLSWLRTYCSKDMLGHPALNVDAARLVADHPLLPRKTVTELINKFTSMTSADVSEWMGRTLTQELDDWYKGTAPETDCYGAYYSSLPSILYQMIDDQMQLAKEISNEAVPSILMVCLDEALSFTNHFKEAVQTFYNKHFEDRSRFPCFTQTMVSIANVCLMSSELAERLKVNIRLSLQWEPVASTGQAVSPVQLLRCDLLQRIDQLKERWTLNSQIALKYLIGEVTADIAPHLAIILTSKWLDSDGPLETICCTIEDYHQDHSHLKPTLLNDLLLQLEMRIVQEYLKAFDSRRVAFRSYNERKTATDRIHSESEKLRSLFCRLRNEKENATEFESLTVVLDSLSDMMSSQDRSLLALEVSSFVKKFLNIRVDQLAGIIQAREDVGRSEARQLAQDILDQHKLHPKPTGRIAEVFNF
ncbi:hypothetical protein M514_12304 [Trichuris suis]|uniref:Uncharacterized protein n=1 Tax=Trichuris suis TaxID=68888 RepID=A0A085MX97_9BILA|nr:hypothetical protein M514_12304 [Trichuris suis]